MHKSHRRRSYSHDRDRTRDKHKHHSKRKHRRDYSDESDERHRREKKDKKYKRKHQERQDREEFQQRVQEKKEAVQIVKEKPCWQPSGILLQFYNARDGVSLKFHEPPESRAPTDVWRIYIFKDEQMLQPILLTESCYLIGKDDRVCDILCENQTISRQHAVIQFRLKTKIDEEGVFSESIQPYVMDLESTNGTFLNEQKIEPTRYTQLLHKDMLKFGMSQRMYIIVKDQRENISRNEED